MFDVILAEKNKEIERLEEVEDNKGKKTIIKTESISKSTMVEISIDYF